MNKVNFKRLSEVIIFSPKDAKKYIIDNKIQWRKNAGVRDINNAIMKAQKKANGRTENEISWLALYLELYVFKKTKGKK